VASDVWTIPNLITFARFAMVPVFVVLQLTGHTQAALIVFASAAASDGIDGLLARLLNQRSRLGTMLDPIADKLLVFSALIVLVVGHVLPLWLLALILFRDGTMFIGALYVRHKRVSIPVKPTRIGKYATFSLTALVVIALVKTSVEPSGTLDAYVAVVGFLAGLAVAISTAQYFKRFGYLWSARPD
jgi:cardiolipin synthase (CMP-forming)